MHSHMGNNAKRNKKSILVLLIREKRHLFVVWSTFKCTAVLLHKGSIPPNTTNNYMETFGEIQISWILWQDAFLNLSIYFFMNRHTTDRIWSLFTSNAEKRALRSHSKYLDFYMMCKIYYAYILYYYVFILHNNYCFFPVI